MEASALSLAGADVAMAVHSTPSRAVSGNADPAMTHAVLDAYIPSASAAVEVNYAPRIKAEAAAAAQKNHAPLGYAAAAAPEAVRIDPKAALQQARLADLQRQDERVRRHEEAHLAAGAHGVFYRMVMGPDGKAYAVGGHAVVPTVNLSFSPEETIAKAQLAKRVALAPNDPSSQDLRVAADADRIIQQAQLEIQARNSNTSGLMQRSDGSVLSLIGALSTFAHVKPAGAHLPDFGF